jgi:Integrase core domain
VREFYKGYVLVIIDCFTRWVELFAVPEAIAHEVCLCLIQHYFGRYGSPTIIRSDKGSHFTNELIAQCLAATGRLQNFTLLTLQKKTLLLKEVTKKSIDTYLHPPFIPIQLTTINLVYHSSNE